MKEQSQSPGPAGHPRTLDLLVYLDIKGEDVAPNDYVRVDASIPTATDYGSNSIRALVKHFFRKYMCWVLTFLGGSR